jgi:hypothetical protein
MTIIPFLVDRLERGVGSSAPATSTNGRLQKPRTL